MYYYFIALAAIAGMASVGFSWGASYVTRRETEADAAATQKRLEDEKQDLERDRTELRVQLKGLRDAIDHNTQQVFKAMSIKQEVWQSFTINDAPSQVADYIMLLFRTDHGRVLGKVRVKGSSVDTPFSTTSNKNVPVAIPNVWDPEKQHYVDPTVIEFTVTGTSDPASSLTILTKGWVDTRGQEPHL